MMRRYGQYQRDMRGSSVTTSNCSLLAERPSFQWDVHSNAQYLLQAWSTATQLMKGMILTLVLHTSA